MMFDSDDYTVCFSYIHPQDVSSYFMESVLSLLDYDKTIQERISLTSGPRIAAARNTVTEEFLRNRKSDWLVMCDADMVFAPDAVRMLVEAAVERDAKIMGALCYAASVTGAMKPTIFKLVEDDLGRKFELWEHVPPQNSVVKCDGTGTGFILIHRDLLVEMGKRWGKQTIRPWFFEGELKYGDTHYEFGEDVGFCIRAGLLGHDMYVHTGVPVHHHKGQIMTPRHYRQYRRQEKAGMTVEDRERESLLFNYPPQGVMS